MQLNESINIPLGRESVWKALNDIAVLRQCIPGCEELTMNSPTHLTATVTLKVGPIKARFTGDVNLNEIKAPESYIIQGEGKGGGAGFAKGSARVWLEQVSTDNTILHYDASADVGGKIAQLGSRLLDSTAKRLAKKFFENFNTVVSNQTS